jgi:sigma-E factor negative regulatory protein RseA
MSEQIREQVSAFLDGELPNSETELLLKRLTRDAELRESFGRYALIGEALRGASPGVLSRGFSSRVNLAIDGEPVPAAAQPQNARAPRWWRPLAGFGVAAGVAAVAIVALQQRAITPNTAQLSPAAVVKVAPGMPTADRPGVATPGVATPAAAANPAVLTAQNHEALSYTVPAASTEPTSAMAPARLTNYVFAHSKYSSGLGQRGVLADLLIEDDVPGVATPGVATPGVATPGVATPVEVPPVPVKRAAQ